MAKVSGVVKSVYTSSSGQVFFDYCSNYKNCPFSAVIFADDAKNFTNLLGYQGKNIVVTGMIKEYQNTPEIVINSPSNILINNLMLGNKRLFLGLLLAIVIVFVFVAWNAYVKTQTELSLTQNALKETQSALSALESSTTAAIASEAALINSQAKTLTESQSSQASLKDTIVSLQTKEEMAAKSSVTAVNAIARSVVKLVCRINPKGDLQQGSGILYHSISITRPYFIQTNLHVVEPTSGTSSCVIAIYPDNSNPSEYLVFSVKRFERTNI